MTWRELFLRAWAVLRNRFWRAPPICDVCRDFMVRNPKRYECVTEDCRRNKAYVAKTLETPGSVTFHGLFDQMLAPGYRKLMQHQQSALGAYAQQRAGFQDVMQGQLAQMQQLALTPEQKVQQANQMMNEDGNLAKHFGGIH